MYIDPTNIFLEIFTERALRITQATKYQAVIVINDRGVNMLSATGRSDGEHCKKIQF